MKNLFKDRVFSRVYTGEKMTNLKKAPLIYTLGMINFPQVPDIKRFKDKFFDKIRRDYPLPDEVKVRVVNTGFSAEGVHLSQQENELWQFSSIDKKWGIILTDQSLCIHTIEYYDFLNFSDRFEKNLSALLEVPTIDIEWMTSIGFRYVNLIETQDNETLDKYILSWVLPEIPPQDSLSIIEGAYFARYQTTIGELRLQALRKPPFTLPIELQSPLTIKNGWLKTRPENEFAIVDIDHSAVCNECSMSIPNALEKLGNLRKQAKTVFNSIGTPFAKKYWGEE